MGAPRGIDDDDWEHLKDLAVRLCDAEEESEQEQASYRELWAYLDSLEDKYGPLATILATRGDFSRDYEEKENLLQRAWIIWSVSRTLDSGWTA